MNWHSPMSALAVVDVVVVVGVSDLSRAESRRRSL